MKNLKKKAFTLLLIALLTVPSLMLLNPSKAMAKTVINCDATSHVCASLGGNMVVYGIATVHPGQ